MNRWTSGLLKVLLTGVLWANFSVNAEEAGDSKNLIIAGAGPSTEIVTLLAKAFSAKHDGYEIVVPAISIKHKGGLESVVKSKRVFGRTGRPMTAAEHQAFPNLVELPIARIKVAFAVRKDLGVSKMTLDQWFGIYSGEIDNWSELGGPDKPILRLGREQGEASLLAIRETYPSFDGKKFARIYTKEHRLLRGIREVPGAIGFSSESNISSQKDLVALKIDGFVCGLRVALVYDKKHENTETVTRMKAVVQSDHWRRILLEHNYLSVADDENLPRPNG